MRLAKVAIGFAVLAVIAALFFRTSTVPDLIKPLRPYVTTETISYERTSDPGGKTRYVQKRDFVVKGLTVSQAQKLFHSSTPGRSGTTMFATPTTPGGIDPPAGRIIYWGDLSWNEVLWVRLTNMGRDPFARESKWVR